jgi:hypothetical protein
MSKKNLESFVGDLELVRAKMLYMKIADFSREQLDSLIDMIEKLKEKYKEIEKKEVPEK